jgi:hypothetical protein
MKTLLLAIILSLACSPAEAAVIATTKQKKLPVIENVRVEEHLKGFRFDIASMPPVSKYDAWISLTGKRGKKIDEWYVGSVSARRGKKAPREAVFTTDIGDLLRYEDEGTYVLTAHLCTPNMKRPNAVGCANASMTLEYAD